MRSRTWQVANDVVHDLAAGAWPGAALALWLVRSGPLGILPAGTLTVLLAAWSSVYLIALGALGLLVVTGALRVSYRRSAAATGLHVTRIVLVKHAAFATVFVLAIVLAAAALRP